MNLQELQNLQEAYLDVYQELGEQKIDFYAGKLKSGHSPESALNTKYVNITNRLRKDTKSPKDKKKLKSRLNALYNTRDKVEREYDKTQKESYDDFDVILEYLITEGYADTNHAAIAIMANMSDDWRKEIVEEKKPLPLERIESQVKRKHGKFNKKLKANNIFAAQKLIDDTKKLVNVVKTHKYED